jgi:DNA-directed RNA polymerase II subunit RPB4
MAGPNTTKPTVPPMLSRRRPPPTGDEEATAVLRLGEYSTVPTLSVSEANTILQKVIDARQRPDENTGALPPPMPNTDVFVKTRDYLQLFARFNNEQAVRQVETVSQRLAVKEGEEVEEGKITQFERAQLGMYTTRRWDSDLDRKSC